MKKIAILLAGAAVACASGEPLPNTEVFKAPDGGKVTITMISHGSIEISYKDCEIQVDPVGAAIDYSAAPKADIILITHEHGDHLDPSAVIALLKEGTTVICNAASAEKLENPIIMANGDTKTIGGVEVTACPAYNISEGRTRFHPQGNGNAYLLSVGGLKIYVGGDTEDIPEFAQMKGVDVAFLPVNQPYTMTVEQCISAALAMQPKVLIPYHLGDTDMQAIKDGLEGSGIDVRLHETLR